MSTKNNNNGVRIVRVDADRQGQRVDNFITAQLKGVPRSAIYRMIRTGQVRINGGRCKAVSRLETGDEVRIPPARVRGGETHTVSDQVKHQVEQAILFQNQDMLVLNKPSGMAVHAGSGLPWGLIDAVRQSRPDEYCELVHRLDRETSGCLVLARSGAALKHLAAQFREGKARKRYLCLLNGHMSEALIKVDAPLAKVESGARRLVEVTSEGKAALTHFHLLQSFPHCCYVEAELFTGRTHQIRVHAQSLGLPLAGDELYSDRTSLREWKRRGLKRIFLHAHRLALQTRTGEMMEFDAPLPGALKSVLDSLE